jgi:hypothetical protein
MTQLEATNKVNRIRQHVTDQELSDMIGITKNTIYKRLRLISGWKKSELVLINQIKENEFIRKEV